MILESFSHVEFIILHMIKVPRRHPYRWIYYVSYAYCQNTEHSSSAMKYYRNYSECLVTLYYFIYIFNIDKPKVSIRRVADDTLEEGKAVATLTCGADANPPARIFWRKRGSAEERRFVESLEFNPVQRKDSGTYICQAENSIGVSKEEAAEINVLCKYQFHLS